MECTWWLNYNSCLGNVDKLQALEKQTSYLNVIFKQVKFSNLSLYWPSQTILQLFKMKRLFLSAIDWQDNSHCNQHKHNHHQSKKYFKPSNPIILPIVKFIIKLLFLSSACTELCAIHIYTLHVYRTPFVIFKHYLVIFKLAIFNITMQYTLPTCSSV